jgi:hypothetical protein
MYELYQLFYTGVKLGLTNKATYNELKLILYLI